MLSMNRSAIATALEAVAALDHDLAVAIGHADVLAAATYAEARSLWELRRSLERSVSSTRELREELLGVEGDASEHYQEVALRERTTAIVTRLADLALAEYEATGETLYFGRFRRLLDVSTHLVDQIGRVNEECFRARLGADSWRNAISIARSTGHETYQRALAHANDQFALIGQDPDVGQFLRAGAAVESEAFRIACRAIASVLNVSLPVI